MAIKHYVGETGTDFILDCGVMIGSASAQYIKYKTPAGIIGSWSASLYSSYSTIAAAIGTYFVKRTLLTTDFSVPGEWKFQAYIGATDGTWYGETVDLTIYDAFQ